MTDITQKSFWQKPEGKWGILWSPIVLGGLGLGVWSYVVPFVVSLLANTALALGMAAALVAAVLFVWNNIPAILYLYKRMAYRSLNALWKIDPISVLRVAAENTLERAKGMAELRTQLKEQIAITRRTITSNEVESKRNAKEAQSANKFEQYVKVKQAGRLQASNVSLGDFLNKLLGMEKVLELYVNMTTAFGKDMHLDASNKERDRNLMLKGHKILKASTKQLKGQEAAFEQFNRGVEIILEEGLEKMGEIDNFSDIITEAVNKMDMANGFFDAEALTQFEVWEKKADSLLLPAGEKQALLSALDATPRVMAPAQSGSGSFAHLFGDDKK